MRIQLAFTYGPAEFTLPDDLSRLDIDKLERLLYLARACREGTREKEKAAAGSPDPEPTS